MGLSLSPRQILNRTNQIHNSYKNRRNIFTSYSQRSPNMISSLKTTAHVYHRPLTGSGKMKNKNT
jgi:hypothetical protein